MEIEKVSDDNNTQQPQPRKQSRRRLHTSKPYQERLLNMAEARREIATALKFHRASMKQQKPPANHHHLQSSPPPPPPEQQRKSVSGMYSTTNYWPTSTIVPPPPPLNQEHLNLVLPDQTLGLNLNFQDFSNLNTTIYHKPISVYSSSPASSSLSAAKEVAAVNSARWCKSLETIEIGAEEEDRKDVNSHEDDDGYYHPFEQVMEFPSWLVNSNETTCFQQLFDHHFSDDYPPDPALPCMDIGEIEGMDGEWLA